MSKQPPGEPSVSGRRRGRPQKFGRPARLVAVTLPNDVVAWLESLDADVARAIVRLHDETLDRKPLRPGPTPPAAELVDVGEGRALIVVTPSLVRGLAGVAAIPFGKGRAFLALEPTWTMADLELSVMDALERGAMDAGNRDALAEFREQLRGWRTDQSIALEPRAIIVACSKPTRKAKGRPPR